MSELQNLILEHSHQLEGLLKHQCCLITTLYCWKGQRIVEIAERHGNARHLPLTRGNPSLCTRHTKFASKKCFQDFVYGYYLLAVRVPTDNMREQFCNRSQTFCILCLLVTRYLCTT